MADPFEVRMRFSNMLHHLTASHTSAQKASTYALKHREMSEDLHSCILEQLERSPNLNNRANIMYFFEQLCDSSTSVGNGGGVGGVAGDPAALSYVRMMERDIMRIVDLVAPDDGSGAANVKVVRGVLESLRKKRYLNPKTVEELFECIRDRDQIGGVAGGAASPDEGSGSNGATTGGTVGTGGAAPAANGNVRLNKREIEQRIEEDRERHKRLRESIWAVHEDDEFSRAWDEASDVGEDDFTIAREEADERRRCAHFHRLEVQGL